MCSFICRADTRYDVIVCINVLEHFGMCWNSDNPIIDWNKDIRALKKMMQIFNNNIIITIPAGPSIFYGDCLSNGLPFLKRYDMQRIFLIKKIVEENNCKIVNDKLFFSADISRFVEVPSDFLRPEYANCQYTNPNFIWAFCIKHN